MVPTVSTENAFSQTPLSLQPLSSLPQTPQQASNTASSSRSPSKPMVANLLSLLKTNNLTAKQASALRKSGEEEEGGTPETSHEAEKVVMKPLPGSSGFLEGAINGNQHEVGSIPTMAAPGSSANPPSTLADAAVPSHSSPSDPPLHRIESNATLSAPTPPHLSPKAPAKRLPEGGLRTQSQHLSQQQSSVTDDAQSSHSRIPQPSQQFPPAPQHTSNRASPIIPTTAQMMPQPILRSFSLASASDAPGSAPPIPRSGAASTASNVGQPVPGRAWSASSARIWSAFEADVTRTSQTWSQTMQSFVAISREALVDALNHNMVLEESNRQLQHHLQSNTAAVKNAHGRIKQMETDLQSVNKEKQTLVNYGKSFVERTALAERAQRDTQGRFLELEEQLKESKAQRVAERTKFHGLLEAVTKRESAAKEEAANLRSQLDSNVALVADLLEKQSHIDVEAQNQTSIDAEKDDLIARLRNDKVQMKAKLEEAVNNYQGLWDQNSGLQAELKKVRSSTDLPVNAPQSVVQLQSLLERANRRNEELEESLVSANSAVNETEEVTAKAMADLEEHFKSQFEAVQDKCKALGKENKALRDGAGNSGDLVKLKEELDRLREDNEHIIEELGKKDEEVNELKEELKESKEELKELNDLQEAVSTLSARKSTKGKGRLSSLSAAPVSSPLVPPISGRSLTTARGPIADASHGSVAVTGTAAGPSIPTATGPPIEQQGRLLESEITSFSSVPGSTTHKRPRSLFTPASDEDDLESTPLKKTRTASLASEAQPSKSTPAPSSQTPPATVLRPVTAEWVRRSFNITIRRSPEGISCRVCQMEAKKNPTLLQGDSMLPGHPTDEEIVQHMMSTHAHNLARLRAKRIREKKEPADE
ncbi:hypothetical protein P7C73_g1391, partial [Tremellales sp. Uapishka_1]